MSLIVRMRQQKAVYWPPVGETDGFGKAMLQIPVELDVRWDEIQEEFLGRSGALQISSAKVFVGEDLEFGGILWEGALIDCRDPSDPLSNSGAREIRGWKKVANIRATEFLRVAYL